MYYLLKKTFRPLAFVSLLALLAGCQSQLPAIRGANPAVTAMSQRNAQPPERETVGTAKELFVLARLKALDWNPSARLCHVEGAFISANGRNDFPIDAGWTFSFINPSNPFLAYQVSFRSQYTQAVGQEFPRGPLKVQTPIDDSLWTIDSAVALQTAALIAPNTALFTYKVELLTIDKQPVWQIPAMNNTVRINARDGKPLLP